MFKSWLQKLENRIIDISGSEHRTGAGFFSLETVLVWISWVYGRVICLRTKLYERGLLRSHRLPCRVISFGNIVAGGSGKTPMVMHAASLLSAMGLKVVVISRGYGGTAGKKGAVVGDGTCCFLGPGAAGDEPWMMAGRRQFPVVVDRDRVRGGRLAVARFQPHVILLDDGFQHLRIHRDLNIVLMDASLPLGNGRLLPAGRLREPPHAVNNRADGVVYTRCPEGGTSAMAALHWAKPVFLTRHVPFVSRFFRPGQPAAEAASLSMLDGRTAVLFSAIADNNGFRRSVEAVGVTVRAHLCFRDHHRFNDREIQEVLLRAAMLDAPLVVTTEKDYARLGSPEQWPVALAVMGVEIEFMGGSARFGNLLWPLNAVA